MSLKEVVKSTNCCVKSWLVIPETRQKKGKLTFQGLLNAAQHWLQFWALPLHKDTLNKRENLTSMAAINSQVNACLIWAIIQRKEDTRFWTTYKFPTAAFFLVLCHGALNSFSFHSTAVNTTVFMNKHFKIVFLNYSTLMLKGAFSKGTQQCECQGWAGVSANEGQKQGPQGEKHSIHWLFSGPPLWDLT